MTLRDQALAAKRAADEERAAIERRQRLEKEQERLAWKAQLAERLRTWMLGYGIVIDMAHVAHSNSDNAHIIIDGVVFNVYHDQRVGCWAVHPELGPAYGAAGSPTAWGHYDDLPTLEAIGAIYAWLDANPQVKEVP